MCCHQPQQILFVVSVHATCFSHTDHPQTFNPLNTELNPICHLLALVGAHHILCVGRIRVGYMILKLKINEYVF